MARTQLVMLGAILLIPVASAAQAPEAARENADLALTVRTFDSFGVPAGDLSSAQAAAAVIFRKAGIEITWVNCYARDRDLRASSPRCADPQNPSTLMLRIVSERREGMNRSVPMGFSLVNREERWAPHLATVFADRVLRVAHAARTNAVGVLALSIAHELGHVLLATTEHAKVGLMQAVWSHSELRRTRTAELRFLDEDASAMRTNLRAVGSLVCE